MANFLFEFIGIEKYPDPYVNAKLLGNAPAKTLGVISFQVLSSSLLLPAGLNKKLVNPI